MKKNELSQRFLSQKMSEQFQKKCHAFWPVIAKPNSPANEGTAHVEIFKFHAPSSANAMMGSV